MITMKLLYVLLVAENTCILLGIASTLRQRKRLDGSETLIAAAGLTTFLLTLFNTPNFFPGT